MNRLEWKLLEERSPLDSVAIGDAQLKTGDPVRLRPREGGDIFDLALAGKTGIVESIEQNYEGDILLSVVLDEDPGRDIGLMRQPGHRFFFTPEEVEPLSPEVRPRSSSSPHPTVLIAGIGNIFLGDDAFGVALVQRLTTRALPHGVRALDFGIRGMDLAYSLADGADVTILVDACPRGGAPGDLYVIEPDLDAVESGAAAMTLPDAHSLNPVNVIRLARALGGPLKRILVFGCEPLTLGGDSGHMGLSAPVAEAVERAIPMLESLVARILHGAWPSPAEATARSDSDAR